MPFLPSSQTITDTLELIKNDTPYLALYTASPNAGGGGTEVSGGSYARKAITFGAISSGAMSNSSTVTFSGLPTGTITHYGIFDAATSGTFKGYGALNAPVSAASGDQVSFTAGMIAISVSGT